MTHISFYLFQKLLIRHKGTFYCTVHASAHCKMHAYPLNILMAAFMVYGFHQQMNHTSPVCLETNLICRSEKTEIAVAVHAVLQLPQTPVRPCQHDLMRHSFLVVFCNFFIGNARRVFPHL